MPVFLIILLFPFLILVWMGRYLMNLRARQTEQRMREAIAKVERDALIARPLRDYVANLKPQKAAKVSLRVSFLGQSAPTFDNIGRFAALSIRSHSEEYFIQDGNGVVYGPADENAIQQWVCENRITADTLTSNHPEGPWLPARKIRALQKAFHIVDTSISLGRFDHIQIK